MSELPGWLSKLCERAMRPDDGEWASVSHVIARQAYDLDTDDDYFVDLLGLLIDEIERLRAENHELRGLLDTATDAWDSGEWNSLLGMQMCGLPRAWREKTKEALK